MTTAPPNTYLDRQFAAYAADWADVAPGQTLPCRELDERLAYGIHLHRLAQEAFEAAGAELAKTGRAYDIETARYVGGLLTVWMTAAAAALDQLGTVEGAGCRLSRAAEFRELVSDLEVSMSIPIERAAAQAERLAREGHSRAITTEDVRPELRRRMGT